MTKFVYRDWHVRNEIRAQRSGSGLLMHRPTRPQLLQKYKVEIKKNVKFWRTHNNSLFR